MPKRLSLRAQRSNPVALRCRINATGLLRCARNDVLPILVYFFMPTLAFALPADRNQVANVSADKASLDQQKHRGEYLGTVCFDQGTTHLRADKAITQGDKENHLSLAVAYGSPKNLAHYWELLSPEKPPLHAYAEEIRYYPEQHLITLLRSARVVQGNDSFSAPKISFDTQKQHVIALGSGKEKIRIVVHTGKKDG